MFLFLLRMMNANQVFRVVVARQLDIRVLFKANSSLYS
jgi:hypothetical protein